MLAYFFLNSFFCDSAQFFESLTHIFSKAGNCENLSLPNIQISLLNFDYNINQIQARAPCNMPRKELNQSQQQGGQSPFRPRSQISEKVEDNQIQNDGSKVNKVLNTQRGTQYQSVQQGKGENENKDQSSNLIELNNNRMEEQKASEKLPPFAQLCGDIILKLGQFPKKQQLQKSSLTDQIIDMIKQLGSKKQDQSLEQKISSLNNLFISGVDKKDYFNQDRIQSAVDQGKIIFHPTHLVTGQIIRLLVHQELKKYTISYGHPGIAKTFGYYLYHQLSNLFIAETINRQKQVKQFLQQRNIKQIPKLIYLNMKLETKKFNQEQYLTKLKRSLTKQCPQISQQIKITQDTADYRVYAQKICEFYKERGIKVYLLVDQINFIASKFRKYIQNVKKDELPKPQQFQNAQKVNNIRIDLMQKGGFSKIIYNSSVNFEYFYVQENFVQVQILQQEDYEAILSKLRLVHDYPQQKYIVQSRILYPQIMKFDSSIWSLTDTIIFEMKRKFKVQNELKDWRSKIFNFLEKRNNSSLTFLRIRKIIQPMKDNIKNFFDNFKSAIQKTERGAYTQNLKKCCKKTFKKIPYLKILNIIYHQLKQIKQDEENQDQTQNQKIQLITRYFSFLNHPIYCNKDITPVICLNLDRNLFQPFTDQIKASNFLFQLKMFTVKSIENWCSSRMQQEELQSNIFDKYKNKISDKLHFNEQEKNPVDMVIVTLLSSKFLIKLLENRFLSEIDNFSLLEAKQFFTGVPEYVIGYYLQRELINYIQKIDRNESFVFKNENFSFKFKRNEYFQKLKMQQLPRLSPTKKLQAMLKLRNQGQTAEVPVQTFLSENPFKVSNLSIKARSQYKQFIDQFLDKSRQNGCYLFVPQNSNSKSVDFAIQQIIKNTEVVECNIYLFQVTVVSGLPEIKEKIETFLQAHTYAVDYLNEISKFCQTEQPKLTYKINFVLIGVPSNEVNMRNAVIQENKSPFFKYIQNKNRKSYAFLNEIKWINANKIELPGVEKFSLLHALRDILGKSETKPKSEVREKIPLQKNKKSEKKQSSDFEEY